MAPPPPGPTISNPSGCCADATVELRKTNAIKQKSFRIVVFYSDAYCFITWKAVRATPADPGTIEHS